MCEDEGMFSFLRRKPVVQTYSVTPIDSFGYPLAETQQVPVTTPFQQSPVLSFVAITSGILVGVRGANSEFLPVEPFFVPKGDTLQICLGPRFHQEGVIH
jgi:hypothetical protein